MNYKKTFAISFVAVLGLYTHLATVRAQNASATAKGAQHGIPALRDGKHDFDFEVGTWRAHVKKLAHPLTGSQEWDDLFGTVVTRSLPMFEGWNESEMRVDSPSTHTHIELLAVRLYSPKSRQWSIYGSSAKTGVFDPPQVGQFNNGRGEFYAQDTLQGRAIFIRFVWENVSASATHFEQAFSIDGGRTWEPNWIFDGTRIKE